MLNNAQRNHLRIVMSLIEAKMRTIESRLANSEEHGLMSEIRNDITPAMEQALREKIQVIYAVIDELRTRFGLPAETKLASREILTGLSQLWVMLQESDAKALGGMGPLIRPSPLCSIPRSRGWPDSCSHWRTLRWAALSQRYVRPVPSSLSVEWAGKSRIWQSRRGHNPQPIRKG